MKKVTVEQFKSFDPCWLETAEGRKKFRKIAAIRKEWTALDVLALPDVDAEDKLWSVLRPEFLPEELLHEFACRCAEYALSFIEKPDPRSVAAIEAKRAWLRGEISDDELAAASAAAWDARDAASAAAWAASAAAWAARAARTAAWDAASAAAWDARAAAWDAVSAAAWDARAAWAAASAAAWDARAAASAAAREDARDHEVEMLVELIKEK